MTGWKLSGARNEEVTGSVLTINMTSGKLTIEPILGDASGIAEMAVNESTTQQPLYDLTGRMVSNPTRGGIYIQNGKKVIWQ